MHGVQRRPEEKEIQTPYSTVFLSQQYDVAAEGAAKLEEKFARNTKARRMQTDFMSPFFALVNNNYSTQAIKSGTEIVKSIGGERKKEGEEKRRKRQGWRGERRRYVHQG